MIRLRGARFTNFRGLRDVQIEFAAEGEHPLTVIRAENATGKTSMLYGLTWCLFGESGLPVSTRRRGSYRISPVDWDAVEDGAEINVEVAVKVTVGDDVHADDYEIIRRATETVREGGFDYTPSSVVVYKETSVGSTALPNPMTFLELDLLPIALKDIFFLDGDEALKDYVESARDDTRKNVRDAVRNLLGLEVLEQAQKHLDLVRRQISSAVKNESSGELAGVSGRLLDIDSAIEQLTDEVADLQQDVKAAEQRYEAADRQRSEVLANGGQETKVLEGQERAARAQVRAAQEREAELIKRQRALLSSPDLLHVIARDTLLQAAETYEQLRRERKIPNALPELVREQLRQKVCICGASLEPGTPGHSHLSQELAESERYDDAHRVLTELAALAATAITTSEPGDRSWFTQSRDNTTAWLTARKAISENEVLAKELETRIRSASQSGDFETADSRRSMEFANLKEVRSRLSAQEHALASQQKERETLRKQFETLQRKESRFRRRLAEQQAVQDMLNVISGTITVLQDETVDRVGSEMNAVFQQLVAAAPGELDSAPAVADAVVQEIRLTRTCDIVVLGPLGREIIPSNGLSGAQRRALTIAFILALTKISGVFAPLVIDTPLGMTSGTIRRALLANTLRNSQQVVLFLTRDEIKGVEDILDEATGLHYTLTNTQHAIHALDPAFAKDRPMEVIICQCRYDSSCSVCARKAD
ncbi:DNA sulfur modification protein DndD [Geodermatophilus obscurus]|uniref:Nuclease SbcCD subunit C n=1 Tax=Geodermatophilus obscurus TaxID=1861 RepID=A0A1M7S311_9ACTN|nr:AAA family ATPase [Geodermatophilus obscurus]SHN52858.1 DNA sulfur modification protein DndD [Geodermatophilus obscurus]